MKRTTRRRFIASGAAASAIAVAGCGQDETEEPDPDDGTDETEEEPDDEAEDQDQDEEPFEAGYEIWAADQGTDTVYIYELVDEGGEEFEIIDEIDTGAEDGFVPHMVDYSSDYEYVAIPCTVGGRVLVYRTEDRELVANLETGGGSHFASFSPDDEYLTVDVIGENRIAKVDIDLEAEEFEETDEIVLEDVEGQTEDNDPVCHQFDGNGRSIHTLGPSYFDAGVVVVDHDDFSVSQSFTDDELPANCGTVPHPTEDKFYLTAGLPSDPDGERDLADGVGDYFVLDTSGEEVEISAQGSTNGVDAHGFWFTPDVEELWVLNRETNDGIVLDPETDEVIDEIDAFGPEISEDTAERDSPDIQWGSPDGEFMFVTLRGPSPQSGDPHAATGVNPGFSVLDVESREILTTIQPEPDNEDSDFHGIGVRPTEDFDGFNLPPYQ